MTSERSEAVRVGLVALFVTALVTSQVTASKLLAFSLPFSLPLAGSTLVLPGAALAYALTFFASDCYAELYGRRAATVVVNVGFAMNFVLLALVWSTILAPGLPQSAQPVDLAAFRNVLGASTAIVVASLSAYVVSQNWDVFVFHWLRDRTDGEKLWLRNIGSTASSQLIDTVIFVGVGFVLFQGVPPAEALALIVGQYLLKLAIAVVDTPFVYAVVGFARRNDVVTAPASAD
ncbi:queuosine precursor transporter [Haloarcula sp. Atlit-7R]|uniref:queuosine precursor transporter n=1 Tax=Haloarcula sp. Atlit-7R TaxID=2282125 RepID=UPI000EF1618E|nr:queuosine precursor transporter [Haloarcula sp. Atlit-7R]RLM96649.1 VUT family protein [Haloarcula sp. Atlit-7R]